MTTVPPVVLDEYGFADHQVDEVAGGLINSTFRVADGRGRTFAALQRLHPVFGAEVNLDIEAITRHMQVRGLLTPTLIRTQRGEAWVCADDQVWRAITWIDGVCVPALASGEQAESAAQLVAHFHRAVADLDHRFHFARAGVHDTARHLGRLQDCEPTTLLARWPSHASEAVELRREILEQAAGLPLLAQPPRRICHGDLKVSNMLFDEENHAICLIDLDTVGMMTIAFELGDALRSWANPAGEDVPAPQVAEDIIAAAARGYARGAAGLLTREEIDSVIPGLETVCVELAARFCYDIWDDAYFGWNAQRYASRREHNLVRARGQLSLGRSVARRRVQLQDHWRSAF